MVIPTQDDKGCMARFLKPRCPPYQCHCRSRQPSTILSRQGFNLKQQKSTTRDCYRGHCSTLGGVLDYGLSPTTLSRTDHPMTTESTARRPFHAVILAGGRGTRMQSTLPKLLHPIAGQGLLQWVIDAAQRAGAVSVTVVLPPDEPLLSQACGAVQQVVQPVPLGTGDALRCAMPALPQDDLPVAVIYGDTPFLQAETIGAMVVAVAQGNSDTPPHAPAPSILLLATRAAEPNAYSRLLMEADGQVTGLVEWLDASPVQRALPLSFAGAMALRRAPLAALLAGLDNHNAKQEFYLTQLVALANRERLGVWAQEVAEVEIMG
ncbi:MAG: hypothetical protein FJX22_00615, partial [Alphaproteobacteria bacterium]|nr:hypothetical protein [Alphaproteobacteria bacterium]